MRSPARKISVIVALLGLGLGAWAFYSLAAFTSRAGTTAPLYAPQRHDPFGTAALQGLLAKRGRSMRLLKSPRQLHEAEGVLLQVLPYPTEDDAGQSGSAGGGSGHGSSGVGGGHDAPRIGAGRLKTWIAAGHTVVQLTRRRTPLMDALGVPQGYIPADLARDVEKQQRHGHEPEKLPGKLQAYPWRSQRGQIVGIQTNQPLRLRAPRFYAKLKKKQATTQPATQGAAEDWTPLAGSGLAPVAGVVRHGEGRLIVVGAPTPALNHTLGEGGNLALMLAMLARADSPDETQGAGPPPGVWFDAWSIGMGYPGSVMGLIRQFGLLPAVLQVVLVVMIYHWSGRGHQRTAAPRMSRRRSSSEQLSTLGHLYSRSMPADELARRTYMLVLHRLARALRWPVGEVETRLGFGQPGGGSPKVGGTGVSPVRGSTQTHSRAGATVEPASVGSDLVPARDLLRRARALAGRFPVKCRQCGYNLVGSGGQTCPECGGSLTPHQRRQLALIPAEYAGGEQTPAREDIEKDAIDLIDRTHRVTEELARHHGPGPRR